MEYTKEEKKIITGALKSVLYTFYNGVDIEIAKNQKSSFASVMEKRRSELLSLIKKITNN